MFNQIPYHFNLKSSSYTLNNDCTSPCFAKIGDVCDSLQALTCNQQSWTPSSQHSHKRNWNKCCDYAGVRSSFAGTPPIPPTPPGKPVLIPLISLMRRSHGLLTLATANWNENMPSEADSDNTEKGIQSPKTAEKRHSKCKYLNDVHGWNIEIFQRYFGALFEALRAGTPRSNGGEIATSSKTWCVQKKYIYHKASHIAWTGSS